MADMPKRIKRLLREHAADAHEEELPARELFARYNTPHLEMTVAYAITLGVLDRQQIPAELRDHLARALEFYEGQRASKA